MSEVERLGEPTLARESCYGCIHQRYVGASSLKSVKDMVGGTAIPLREQDVQNGPGRYECALFGEVICTADKTPRPLAAGGECKERR